MRNLNPKLDTPNRASAQKGLLAPRALKLTRCEAEETDSCVCTL